MGGDDVNPCFTCDERSGCKTICYKKLEYDIFDRPKVKLKCKKTMNVVSSKSKNEKYISKLNNSYVVDKDGLVSIK